MAGDDDLKESIRQHELDENNGVRMMQYLLLALPLSIALWGALAWAVVLIR